MKCPKDGTKITSKHYDADYEIYECPKCGEAFTADEMEEAEHGTSPRKRGEEVALRSAQKNAGRPQAKGKKKRAEIAKDDEAIAKYEAALTTPKVKAEKETKHRDLVNTVDILEIVADEIQAYSVDMGGVEIDRLNAREFFAMNLIRPMLNAGVHFREKDVSRAYCKEHK